MWDDVFATFPAVKAHHNHWFFGGLFALVGAGLGTIGSDKTIRIEGMPDSVVKVTLEKLRKKARVPDNQRLKKKCWLYDRRYAWHSGKESGGPTQPA